MRFDWSTSVIWLVVSKLWEFTVVNAGTCLFWNLKVLCIFLKNLQLHERNLSIHVHASYIVLFFVKTENNNFIKEIKHVFLEFIAWWKHRQSLWEFLSRWKPWTAARVFTSVSAFKFSQTTFASVFTRLWRNGEHVLFLKRRACYTWTKWLWQHIIKFLCSFFLFSSFSTRFFL